MYFMNACFRKVKSIRNAYDHHQTEPCSSPSHRPPTDPVLPASSAPWEAAPAATVPAAVVVSEAVAIGPAAVHLS